MLKNDRLRGRAEQVAQRQTLASPATPDDLTPEEVQRVLHELREHQIQLGMRNEELRRTRVELDAARARDAALYDLAPAGLCTLSEKGLILEANLATAKLLGLERSTLVKRPLLRYILKQDHGAFHLWRRQLAESGTPQTFELRMTKRDGTAFLTHFVISAGQTDDGQPVCHVVLNDTPERRRAEEKIESQAGWIKSLLDSIPDIIFFKDLDGVYLGCNPPFAEFVGRSRDEIVGRTDFELFGWEVATSFRQHDQSILESGESRHNEEWITYPDARKILIDTLKTPYRSPDGDMIGVLGVSRDITERHRGEQELRRTTERLALAVRAGGVGIWDYDVLNNRLLWDEQMFRLYGITRDPFCGAYEAWQAGLHPDDRQRCDAEILLALQGKKEFDTEFRVLWPDASEHNIRGCASVERDAAGRPVRMIGTNWDITEQKRTGAALRDSEANFRTFFESMSDMILVGTPVGRILFTNAAVTRMLGYSQAELRDMHLLDVHPPDKRQEAEEIFGAMFRGERESCPLPLVRKDGGLVPVDTRVWFGNWNGAACLFGICKNLSEEQEAKQRFERLFRNNPCVCALSSLPDHRFLDVNDAFMKTLGYARDEVLGKLSMDLGLFVQPERYVSARDQLCAQGCFIDCEMQIRRKGGAVLDGIFSGEVISSQGHQYLLTVMMDITERKRAEVELARVSVIQRELMCLATEFVNVPLGRQDAAIDQSLATMGQIIHADRAYLFAYDFAAGVMSNTHEWCGEGITPEIDNLQALPNDMLSDWVDAHRRGELIHIPSVKELPPDGYLRQTLDPQGIRTLITLPLMQGETCLGFVGFDAVRTERVWRQEEIALLRVLAELYAHFEARRAGECASLQLQQQLIQARDAAQAAALAKSLFLANMSHEIRTPLNAILGYAQIMERECRACPTGVPRLSAITRSAEHLLGLLTDLLELVRDDTHPSTLAEQAFDFYQALEDVRLMFARNPMVPGLTLEVSHAPDVPQFVHSDPGKVRQILVNLIGNAIKFTAIGRVRLSASVLPDTAAADVTMVVDVEDTGCGIGPDEVDGIFDVFEQALHGRKSGKGTGLGLPLSRRYAQALGGDITVSSRLGVGSRFRFTFKARVGSDRAAERAQVGCVHRLAPDQPACRVLVVDDEPENREMLAGMLRAVGFRVKAAANAARALQHLRQGRGVDLVLMDKRLPEMDGYEAIRRLRELPGWRELPVLVVTASGDADEKQFALAAGANGYVAKPVRRELLLAEIGRIAGVRYDYDPLPDAPPPTMAVPPLDAAALTSLTTAQRQRLDQALRCGDIQQLRELTAGLEHAHAGLAAGMRGLVDAYDYGRLRCLLDQIPQKPYAD